MISPLSDLFDAGTLRVGRFRTVVGVLVVRCVLPRTVPVWSDAIWRHVLSVVRPMRGMKADADVRRSRLVEHLVGQDNETYVEGPLKLSGP